MTAEMPISYRPLAESDLAFVPLQCQGEPEEIRARLAAAGSSAMLAFEGDRCVAQLQFRPYQPDARSPRGIHHPLYWMDYPQEMPALPERTLSLFCYHVGQVEADPEQRDRRYHGRGIGTKLLRQTVAWAAANGFQAVAAKGLAPSWATIQYMGAMPCAVYEREGFVAIHDYVDADLRAVLDEILLGAYGARRLLELTDEIEHGADLDALARVQVYVRT